MHFAKKLSIDLIVLEKMKGDCKKSTLALIGSSTSSSNHCLISYQIKCIKKIGKTTFYISFMKLGKRNNFFFLHLNVPF